MSSMADVFIAARSPIRMKPDIYHPTIVIGCAIEKGIRRAMLNSREKLAIMAMARDTPLIASSLEETL